MCSRPMFYKIVYSCIPNHANVAHCVINSCSHDCTLTLTVYDPGLSIKKAKGELQNNFMMDGQRNKLQSEQGPCLNLKVTSIVQTNSS